MEFLNKFNPLTADYRKKEPLSVKTIKGATALTPLDSVVEISKELKEEEPDYKKIGLLTAMEAAGLAAPMAKPAMTAIKAGKANKTVKAYKLFSKGKDGKLYPLFVDADTPVPIGKNLKATFPEYRFQAKNGNFYVPSRGPKGSKGTGDMIEIPDQETRDMLIEAGFLPKGSKAKSIRSVAARPGWHAGDNPTAPHIGPETKINGKKYKIRGDNQVWAEVEMPDDIDWQAIADSRAVMKKDGTPNVKTAHITDELPFGGHYRYKTNPNMQGNWLISGDMKVIRELDKDEVKRLNKAAGVEDLPTLEELKQKVGFASGGIVGDNMYKGMDDYLMSEMEVGMAKGGTVEEQMSMNFGEDVPDNTVGVDPVSGNEIPLGSTAENVRDDIPANLSEGEIVVPADVVNFHGVKLFEDLRKEAKMGYAKMAEDGRIGGEPMDMEEDLPFDISELQTEDAPEEEIQGMFLGGLMEAINNALSGKGNENKSKPPSNNSKNEKPSLGKQINFPGFENKNVNEPTAREKIEQRMQNFLSNRDKDDDRPDSGMSFTERAERSRNREDKSTNRFESAISALGNLFEAQVQDKSGPKRPKVGGKIDFDIFGDFNPAARAERNRFAPKYNEGGLEDGDTDTSSMNAGITTRRYRNAEGNIIYVTFAGNTPLSYIPKGYTLAPDEAEDVTPTTPTAPVSGGGGSSDDDDKAKEATVTKYQEMMKGPKWKPDADIEAYQDEITKLTQGGESVAGAMVGGILGGPLVGIGATKLFKGLNDNQLNKIKAAAEEQKTRSDDPDKWQTEIDRITNYLEPKEESKKLGFKLGDFSGFQKVAENISSGFKDSMSWDNDKWNKTNLAEAFPNIMGRDSNNLPNWMGSEQEALVGAIRRGDANIIEHFERVNKFRDARKAYFNNEDYKGNVMLSEDTKRRLDELKASGNAPSGSNSYLAPPPAKNNNNKDDGPSLAEKMQKEAQKRQKEANEFTKSKIEDFQSGKKVTGF